MPCVQLLLKLFLFQSETLALGFFFNSTLDTFDVNIYKRKSAFAKCHRILGVNNGITEPYNSNIHTCTTVHIGHYNLS